ncbi:hypothetical protein [Ruminococcus sp. NK3A76]|uniref:hypothetical protein n=1 Tax=Ruminococcus sp. NK3A76 TaxID=877411 RepID=UPI00048BED41|nr:hypothetical protein [Ruminococcus sp. NK3A76]
MKRSWKRVTAGLLALAMAAGTIPANAQWRDILVSSGIVAHAIDGLEGEGTKDNPYQIRSLDDFQMYLSVSEGDTKYIQLKEDINVNDYITITKDTYITGDHKLYAHYNININNEATVTIDGPTVECADINNSISSTLNIVSGAVKVYRIINYDKAVLNITGGYFDGLIERAGVVSITGGKFNKDMNEENLISFIDTDKYFVYEDSDWFHVLPKNLPYKSAKTAGTNVVYTDAKAETYIPVTDSKSAVTWTSGTYVVSGEVEIDERITVDGTVDLILTDGAKLTASKGITVVKESDSVINTLNIFGQAAGTGALIATGAHASAGIGGGLGKQGGTVTINGGKVTATGSDYSAAGIGGGYSGAGGTVTINGGKVTATGSDSAAGIGGGEGGAGGTVTINGGQVTATGSDYAAGIGGGFGKQGGTVIVNGGNVTAVGGGYAAGIGGGYNGAGGAVTINGGQVTATGGVHSVGIGKGEGAPDNGTLTIGDSLVLQNSSNNADWKKVDNNNGYARTRYMRTAKKLVPGQFLGVGDQIFFEEDTCIAAADKTDKLNANYTSMLYRVEFSSDRSDYWFYFDSDIYVIDTNETLPVPHILAAITIPSAPLTPAPTGFWVSDGSGTETDPYIFGLTPVLTIGAISDLELTYGYTSGALSVDAAADEGYTLSYQWYKNTADSNTGGTAISGATSASYTIPTGKNAGTEEYYYCVVTATNTTKTVTRTSNAATVTVAKADPLTTAPTAKENLKYTGTAQALVNAAVKKGGTVYYGIGAIEKNGNYVLAGDDLKVGRIFKPSNYSGFNFPQGYSVKIGEATCAPYSGTTVSSAAGMVNVFYDSNIDLQRYRIMYGNHQFRDLSAGCDALKITDINDEQHLITVEEVDSAAAVSWGETGALPTAANVGTYPVYYKVDGGTNYNDVAATKIADVTIGVADNGWKTAPVLVSDLMYLGTPVSLIKTPGTPKFGEADTALYAVTTTDTAPLESADVWTTYDNIKANEAGTYYLWYKNSSASTNWNAVAPTKLGAVTVTQKSEQTWTISMPDYNYDGTAHEPAIEGTTYGKLTYTYFTSAGICIGTTAPTEPGDYRVGLAASGDETHFSRYESVEYTIRGARFNAGNTVSFKDKVEFNFLVEATDPAAVEGAYVVFTYDHYGEKMTVKKAIDKSDRNGKYYRVRLPLTASEMAVDIKAELYLASLDKPIDTKTRSIKDYAEAAIMADLDGADVLKAMLNYGGYTQTALGNNTSLLANSGEGIAVDVSTIVPKSETTFLRPVAANGAKVTYKGSTVMTKSDVFVRHYFGVDKSITAAELNAVKINVGDKEVSFKELLKNSAGYYYDVAPELAYDLDRETDRITVYGFAGAETADSANAINIENYNVIDYCEAVANNADQSAANKNMVKALYAYYKAAKAYVDKRS